VAQKTRPIASSICFVGGLLTFAPSSAAHPAECFPGPDFQAYQGARWKYRRDPMTSQGCWYLERTGPVSRRGAGKLTQPSPVVPPSRSAAAWDEPGGDKWEARPARPSQPFSAWFWSGFGSESNSRQAYTTAAQGEAATGEISPRSTRRRDDEPIAQKKPQRSKTEQQSKVAQRKSDGTSRSETAYIPYRSCPGADAPSLP
jgi:hypothetical protein